MLYRLADRLLLLKYYDNKMVKLPGVPLFWHLHVADQQQQQKKTNKVFQLRILDKLRQTRDCEQLQHRQKIPGVIFAIRCFSFMEYSKFE